MKDEERLIAVCGLDCARCDIYRVPVDEGAAERVVAWFRGEGWLKEDEGVPEIVERRMYCRGCRGDRSVHWSADCAILTCCVDEKGLASCHACDEFVCQRLKAWAQGNARHAEALKRLQTLKVSEDL